ncbi:MAG: aminotransferase class IV [Acidimicrobiia bacterium]
MSSRDVVCLIDGEAVDDLDVTDSAVLRGDGCFEAIRSYDGSLFRVEDHLDRLERSAAALGLVPPPRDSMHRWMAAVIDGRNDCVVRIVLTRGSAVPGIEGGGRCVVMSHALPPPLPGLRLLPVTAPWHPAGRPWELAGVKTTSYAPNLAASRRAREAGFDDALLVGDAGTVLEGPTFAIGWCRRGTVFTPSLDLGVLASVTRRVVLELVAVEEVAVDLSAIAEADEVFAMSTVKEVTPVTAVGEVEFAVGPATRDLAQRVGALARDSVSRH